jgi:hypothetical protein
MTVVPEEVAVELGVSAPTVLEINQWQSWINQATYLIGKRLTVTDLDQNDVDYVVLQAVVAHARNPENLTQVTVAVDDASTSRTYSSGSGRVVIPDELWGLLDPDMANESGVGSTQLYGEPDPDAYDPWVGA